MARMNEVMRVTADQGPATAGGLVPFSLYLNGDAAQVRVQMELPPDVAMALQRGVTEHFAAVEIEIRGPL